MKVCNLIGDDLDDWVAKECEDGSLIDEMAKIFGIDDIYRLRTELPDSE